MEGDIMKTDNTIIIRGEFAGSTREMQPVMRNGKPTKKMKTVYVNKYEDMIASGYMFEGHEVFLNDKDMADDDMTYARVYKADGTRLTCCCKYGRYGTADHEQIMRYSKKQNDLITDDYGYCGATWRGHGARINKINW